MSQKQVYVPSKIRCVKEDGTSDVYIVNEKLGQGGFAVVHRVTEQSSNKTYAMKVISKNRGKLTVDKVSNEIQIQKKLNHENIVNSKLSFSDELNQYIVLEYCPGKSVREYLKKSDNRRLSESETRKILKDVIQGLIYLHNRNIIHHDIKLENFLIGSDGRVKIADFGVSTVLTSGKDKSFSLCGTTNYMSPEILQKENKGHGLEVDVWAIGVCAFVMLTGQQPFIGFEKNVIFDKIKKCEYRFPQNVQLSYEARDFVRSILRIDPRRRPPALSLLNHPFMTKYDKEQVQLYKPLFQTPSKTLQIKSIPSLISNNNNNNLNLGCFNNHCSPILMRSSNNNIQIIKPKLSDDLQSSVKKLERNYVNNYAQENCQLNNMSIYNKKNFLIPKHFVTKYWFYNDDLGFLLADGTVGVCFNDRSRMVMDPNEEFVQYYKNYNANEEVIKLEESLNESQKIKLQSKIDLIQKFAKNFKKFKYLYKIEDEFYDPCIPLYHVKYFVKKHDAILFKLNDKNIQVNFLDHKKLLIFMNMKKMCITNNFNDKCNLLELKDVVAMNPICDEYKKYKIAKELLISLSMKI